MLAVVWWLNLAPTVIGGPATYLVVDGNSMKPSLNDGDLVIAKKSSDVAIGDLVVFQTSGGLVVHRIFGGASGAWQTKGDYQNAPDDWVVANNQIIGEKLVSIPGVGQVFRTLRNQPVLLATLASGAVALALLMVSVSLSASLALASTSNTIVVLSLVLAVLLLTAGARL